MNDVIHPGPLSAAYRPLEEPEEPQDDDDQDDRDQGADDPVVAHGPSSPGVRASAMTPPQHTMPAARREARPPTALAASSSAHTFVLCCAFSFTIAPVAPPHARPGLFAAPAHLLCCALV